MPWFTSRCDCQLLSEESETLALPIGRGLHATRPACAPVRVWFGPRPNEAAALVNVDRSCRSRIWSSHSHVARRGNPDGHTDEPLFEAAVVHGGWR